MPAPKGNKNAKGNEGGRPSKYKPEYAELAYKVALLGAIDEELADIFNVTVSTVSLWKKKHVEFSEALKKGKGEADANVANRLYKRACGYEHKDTKPQWIYDDEGGRWEYAEMIKCYPPDTTAAIFWLKNRQPDKWRDRKEIEHSGSVEMIEKQVQNELEKLKTDDLIKIAHEISEPKKNKIKKKNV